MTNHHSKPRYKEMYNQWSGKGGGKGWGGWSPQLPKNTRGKKAEKEKEKPAKDRKDVGVIKPYDSTSLPSSFGGPAVDGEHTLIKDFLDYLKESKVEIPEKLRKHIPDQTKEDIRTQQKRLNRHRTVVNRIEAKKKALEKDREGKPG